MSDKLLKILAVPIMWVLLMIVFPAGVWAFLLIAYYIYRYIWGLVLGW
jgi:hypothetical protein